MAAPHKRALSIDHPEVGPADWSRLDWQTLTEEFDSITAAARDLRIWLALGSIHLPPNAERPFNSLQIVSDEGAVVGRYDERHLSRTKATYMYSRGTGPTVFEVDGFRFGCALGIEGHFPDVFMEYESLGVDCVLLSTLGGFPEEGPTFAMEAAAHAATNSIAVSFAVSAQYSSFAPAGIIDADGRWLARCRADGTDALLIETLTAEREHPARMWRRESRQRNARPE